MPGRVVMESDVANPPASLKMDLSDTAMVPTDTPTNGNGNGSDNDNGLSNTTAKTQLLPPELESWAHSYFPMGKILERMAQQCYHDLGETIDQMADLTITQPPLQTNGASTAAPDTSRESVDKKLRLMNFAQAQKDRFIKALVLSDWARNMEDMDKMIDLNMWLQAQGTASFEVCDAIMNLKRNMVAAKMPNPNIEGALELLTTSKAPWMPDLGYIPPKPLSAQRLLKALRDMNFALSVRLNLHEELPLHFCNYSIANGRATFLVPHEFELDLAVVDDEADSPFYFVDLRFVFADAPVLSDTSVRTVLENKVNQVLGVDGLSACYDFLHGFVLTHKISVLRRQAQELARSRWTECLRVEPVHRSVVVQYWTKQPGGKSWIEIGVSKSHQGKKNHGKTSTGVRLHTRWFREGKEISDVTFPIDPADPSIEKILDQVTAAHITLRLSTVNDQLRAISPPDSALNLDLQTSSTDPNACSLTMKLGPSGTTTSLRISPVTGNVCISPVNAISTDVEKRLNADPIINASQILAYLNCKLLQDSITKQALRAGWLLMPTDNQQDPRRIFGNSVIRRNTFTRRGWGEDWAIALTIGLSGATWWIARLASTQTGRYIQSAERLNTSSTSNSIGRQNLLSIESKAVAQVSLSNITSQLRDAKVHHEIRHVTTTGTAQNSLPTAGVYLNFEDLMQPQDEKIRKVWKPCCQSVMTLSHHGSDEISHEDEVKVTHVLRVALQTQVATDLISSVNKDRSTDDIVFTSDGVCSLKMRTRFGAGLVALAQAKLRRIERLSACLRLLKKHNFTLDKASVTCVLFTYQKSPQLSAEIVFSDEPMQPMQIDLHAPANIKSPHLRLQPMLAKLLTGKLQTEPLSIVEEALRFDALLHYLRTTLPLLHTYSIIETRDPGTLHSQLSPRGFKYFKIVYKSPSVNVVLDLNENRKGGKDVWVVQLAKDQPIKDENLLKALRAAWKQEIDGVTAFTSGAIAELHGVEQLLLNLDDVIRSRALPHNDNKMASGTEVVVLD